MTPPEPRPISIRSILDSGIEDQLTELKSLFLIRTPLTNTSVFSSPTDPKPRRSTAADCVPLPKKLFVRDKPDLEAKNSGNVC